MPQRKRSGTFKSAPKVFRCAGFGNCDMVFTRSEHLARHQRKHTGEKPYKCIVQGCGRMFSRFDNMMQHTQTHEKHKKRISHSPEKKESDNSSQSSATDPSSPIDMDDWMYRKNSMPDLANPLPFEHSMVKNRILPPPRRASISVLSSYNSCPLPLSQVASSPMQMYPSQETPSLFTPGNRFSWPIYQRQSEENYYGSHSLMCDSYNRRSSTSTHSTDSGHSTSSYSQQSFGSLTDPPIRRRISIDDLRTPIEEFKSIKLESSPKHNQAASVDITSDEYEALEGFSKFSKQPFISNKKNEDLYHINSAYQVCAIRQRLMSLKESFQRPIRYTEN